MSDVVTLKLTAIQAKVLFAIVDGQADAGACVGGNTKQEARAIQQITSKLLDKIDIWSSVKLEGGR